MTSFRSHNITSTHHNLFILFHLFHHPYHIILLWELHVRIGYQGIFVAFICSIAQSDVISCIISLIFMIFNQSTLFFLVQGSQIFQVIFGRTIVNNYNLYINPLLFFQERDALTAIGGGVVVEYYYWNYHIVMFCNLICLFGKKAHTEIL